MTYLTTEDVAKDLGIAKRTAQHYCKEGFLPTKLTLVNNKVEYKIDSSQYLEWKYKHFNGVKKGSINKYTRTTKNLNKNELMNLAEDWLEWCATGKLTGKPIAPRTVELYRYYFSLYFKTLSHDSVHITKPIVSINNIRQVLGSFPVESFSTKLNIYSALMSFSKFLIENEKQDQDFRDRLKTLRPRRFLPAKKTSLSEAQLINKVDEIESGYSNYDKLTAKTLIAFLANTGLRASECCSLKLKDVDLETMKVYVHLGKGNKNRIVGVNDETRRLLIKYLSERLKRSSASVSQDSFFINRLGNPFNNQTLSRKVNKLAKRIGLQNIGAHSLRRSFVTINANKGHPLNHLRIACGHADLSTTQGYCMTSVDEVVEAMKNW